MKYCPYCGADLIEDAVSFCAECGKQLPAGKPQKEKSKEKPEIKKIAKKKKTALSCKFCQTARSKKFALHPQKRRRLDRTPQVYTLAQNFFLQVFQAS